jgi:hypothetical protein
MTLAAGNFKIQDFGPLSGLHILGMTLQGKGKEKLSGASFMRTLILFIRALPMI